MPAWAKSTRAPIKCDQAAAAYDAAAKADPTKAGFYYKNEAVIFSQVGNTDAQAAAAEKAIAANANDPIPYYLKGQSLIGKATVDPKTSRIVLPPGLRRGLSEVSRARSHRPLLC